MACYASGHKKTAMMHSDSPDLHWERMNLIPQSAKYSKLRSTKN